MCVLACPPCARRKARPAWRTLAARSSGLTERRATFRELVTILEHGWTGGDVGMGRESSLGRAGNHLEGAFERVGRFPEMHSRAVAELLDGECRRRTYDWEEHAN